MPRSVSPAMATFLQGTALTIATLVRVDRTDGTSFGLTSTNASLTYSGLIYTPINSVQPTAVKSNADTGIDTMEIIGALGAEIEDDDVEQGVYDNARITVMIVNYMDLTMGQLTLLTARFGNFTFKDSTYSAELMSLSSLLKQSIGDMTQAGCRVRRLGDTACKVDVTAYQTTGTISALNGTGTVSVDNPIDKGNIGGPDYQDWTGLAANSGGSDGAPTTHSIDLTGVSLPEIAAPQAIYQSYCFGNGMVFNFPALTPLQTYTVQLHFAEIYFGPGGNRPPGLFVGGGGTRVFDVFVQGIKVLDHLDVYALLGANNKAYVWRGTAIADASGYISITFGGHSDNAMISGIEILDSQGFALTNGYQVDGISEPGGYYDSGVLYVLSGASAGKQFDIKNHVENAGSAVFTLRSGLVPNIAIGDTVKLEAGCDRSITTCQSKFNNTINFHGEPYLPGNTKLIQVGRGPS